jgi:hypothetical protein
VSKRDRKAQQRMVRSGGEDQAGRLPVAATPRHLDANADYSGAGELLLRLAWQPAFEPSMVWEIRSAEGRLMAFRSSGMEPGSPMVIGHDPIEIDDAVLRMALDELSLVTVPLTPALTNVLVADGATFFATIHVGFSTSLRLSWCDEHEPESWGSMVRALLRLRSLLEHPDHESPPSLTPFLVECSSSTAQLVRLSSGDFHVWVAGSLGSLVCGPDHILASNVLAEALRAACAGDLEVVSATISSKATGESWSSYCEIRPIAELRGPHDLPAARLSARTAWRFQGGHLFVSPAVKEKLMRLRLVDLEFSVGFSHFGGMRGY